MTIKAKVFALLIVISALLTLVLMMNYHTMLEIDDGFQVLNEWAQQGGDSRAKEATLSMQEHLDEQKTAVGALVLLLALAPVPLMLIGVKTMRAIENINRALHANNGDLTMRLNEKGKDEIASISASVNRFTEMLHATISDAKESAERNAKLAKNLSAAARVIAAQVEDEARLARQTAQDGKKAAEDLQKKRRPRQRRARRHDPRQ